MSQIPPPPPGQPAPMSGAGAAASNKRMYTILSYVLGWLGGLIFLFVGKDDPDVKWNAAQSLLIFGSLTILIVILGFIPVIGLLGLLLWLVGFIYWVLFLIQAPQGNGQRIQAPAIGGMISPYVDQIANALHPRTLEQDLELATFGEQLLDERVSRLFRLGRHSGTVPAGTRAAAGAPSHRAGSAP